MKRLLILLAVFTLPLCADDLERTVLMMGKVGSATSPSFSADGSRIAFISNMSGVPQVWTVSSEGGWPDQVTALEDPVSALDWSPDGKWIALQVAPAGGLNEQIYVMRPDGTELRRISEGGKINHRLGTWTPDSKSLLFGSSKRSPQAIDVWIADVTTGATRMVAQNPGVAGIGDVSSDGKSVVVSRVVSRGDGNLYRVSLADGSDTLLTPHTPPAIFIGADFSVTPSTFYTGGNPNRDLLAFGRIRVDNGVAQPLEVIAERGDAELWNFQVNHRKSVAVLSWNVGGRNELTFLDLATGKQHPGPKLPGDIVGGFEFSPDDTKLAMVISGSTLPADIWVMDMGTSKIRQITRSPHPGLDLSTLVRPELVTYAAHDGLQLSGWLYLPKNAKAPYATVLSFHGGPESQERPSFNATYQALLANGIAVFAPNVRGSSGFGKKFVNLDNGAKRVDGVRDIKSTVDHLVKTGISNETKLGIMGGSYGGYMVMAGVTEWPEMFAAGANLFGVVNFETFFKHTEPWMAAISTKEYGDPATEAEMLRSLSPIHRVDRVKTPLIVLHGANDTNVPVIEAEQIVENLKKRNVAVEYVLFPDEGHGWRKTPNRIKSILSLTKFFKEKLAA